MLDTSLHNSLLGTARFTQPSIGSTLTENYTLEAYDASFADVMLLDHKKNFDSSFENVLSRVLSRCELHRLLNNGIGETSQYTSISGYPNILITVSTPLDGFIVMIVTPSNPSYDIPDAMWHKNSLEQYVIINNQFAITCGQDKQHFVGKTDFDLFDTHCAQRSSHYDQQVLRSGVQHLSNNPIIDTSGSIHWMETLRTPILSNSGTVVGLTGIVRDVTSQKLLEATLRRTKENARVREAQLLQKNNSLNKQLFEAKTPATQQLKNTENLYHRIFTNIANSIAIIDNDARILEYNLAFSQMLGYSKAELLGKCIFHFAVGKHNLACIKDNDPFELSLVTKSHHIINVQSTLNVIEADETTGDKYKHCIVLRDLSEQKQTEESYKAMQLKDSVSQIRSEFLASISHDVRTPLNGMLGMLELVLDTPLSSEQQDYIHTAQSSAQHLQSIIDDILDFSIIEAGRIKLRAVSFDLNKQISELHRLFLVRIREKKISFEVDIPNTVPNILIGDANRLQQILVNLVGNAWKFTNPGGTVRISVTTKSTQAGTVSLHFCVSDNGSGIADEYRDKIFETFFQETHTTKPNHGGTGLRLAICQKLVNLMGGTITLDSSTKKGSKFCFTLPFGLHTNVDCKQSTGSVPSHEESTQDQSQAFSFKILLAEDNLVNQRIVVRLLEKEGHQISVANNGLEAVSMFAENKFDLVLMDIQMPKMNGLQATEDIRKFEKEHRDNYTPIIALTAHAMPGDKQRCLDAGMDKYVAKPIKTKDLIAVISSTIHHTKNHTTRKDP